MDKMGIEPKSQKGVQPMAAIIVKITISRGTVSGNIQIENLTENLTAIFSFGIIIRAND